MSLPVVVVGGVRRFHLASIESEVASSYVSNEHKRNYILSRCERFDSVHMHDALYTHSDDDDERANMYKFYYFRESW
jgi:hypothetical protein